MKTRKIKIVIALLSIYSYSYSQTEWDSWNNNYKEKSISQLIINERIYADSVENGLIEGEYYLRMDNYRFQAIYKGEKRKISENVLLSMKRVYKNLGNPEYLSTFDNIKNEYLFAIDGDEYWLPIQPILEKPLKKEINKNEQVYLYCLFLNEHTIKKELYNTLFISEFKQEN
ncbi:MAG: hypothetical protein AB9834_13360 [Lentimicrobium sp.]